MLGRTTAATSSPTWRPNLTVPEQSAASPIAGALTAAQEIVAALALPLSPASVEPLRPLPLADLHQLSRDTTMLYGVGRVDESGRVSNRDIVRALGWQPGEKLESNSHPVAS
jgi:hypothetical protein